MGEGVAEPDIGGQLVTRIGAALVAPSAALSSAARHVGKTPGDAALLLILGFVAVNTGDVVASVWLAIAGDVVMGLQMLVSQLARAASTPLIFLVAGGVGIAILAGKRRSLGADFDLACVAFVPVVVVDVTASLVFTAMGATPTVLALRIIAGVGYAWGGMILVLGVKHARSRPLETES